MVIGLPHLTVSEYLRDFFFGVLAILCAGPCPLCKTPGIQVWLRLRQVLGLPVFRGRCRNLACRAHFTFLPRFVAPAKWYDYVAIEGALVFLAQQGPAVGDPLLAWEEDREKRIDSQATPGPSSSTIRRWWNELGQEDPRRPWFEWATEWSRPLLRFGWPGPVASCGPDGLVGEKVVALVPANTEAPGQPSIPLPSFSPLLVVLLTLGEALLGSPLRPRIALLGVSLWCLESQVGRRCLAGADLVGNVIPGPSPFLAVTLPAGRGYPLEPP